MLVSALIWGQSMDDKRMKRDIEVAENILAALIEEEVSESGLVQGFQVEGTYLDSYGLLFSIQNKFSVFGIGGSPAVIWGDGNRVVSGRVGGRSERGAHAQAYTIHSDSVETVKNETLKSVAETFLADYGYLLSQLPNSERICIKYSKGKSGGLSAVNVLSFSSDGEEISAPGFTMVVTKQAVEDFRTGKINRNALASKIEYSETAEATTAADKELIMLHSIFSRLYQRDLSDGFYMRGNGRMEKIAGLGALYSYSFSSRADRNDLFFGNGKFQYRYFFPNGDAADQDRDRDRARGLQRVYKNDDDEDQEEEEEEIEEPDFDEFLTEFKSHVIEYGSTVRNLKGDEVLSFELNFPSCKDCDDRPEKVKITAKQSVLERYRTGGIDIREAVNQLQVTY